jgi:hypothetical protein
MTIKSRIVLLISLLSLGVGMAMAQIESSTITGTVTDQKGAVVAGANITLTEVNTGVNTTSKSNSVGEYTVPYLPQGLYTVAVQAPGFETYKKTGIGLTSKVTVRIDVQLTVGSVSQTVEVQASTAELQTETSSVQGEVGAHIIMNIPNINDNPMYYATLQSGVVPNSQMYNNEALGVGYSDRQSMSGININGGQVGNNDVQVDGLSVQGAGWHEATQLPNRDALQEVSVTTNTLPADLGGGLGVIQMTTKSGTNAFHGDLAYRMRNEDLNANGTSNNVQSTPRLKYRLNEESVAVGGPVRIPYIFNGRDKLFFFASYSRDSHPSSASNYQTVPTAHQRTGDFSDSCMRNNAGDPVHSQMYNPWTATLVSGQEYSRTQYPVGANSRVCSGDGSTAGSGDIVANEAGTAPNAAALVIESQFPLPNYSGSHYNPDFQDNNFYWQGTSSTVRDNFSARIDVHLLPKNSLYVSGGTQLGTTTSPNIWTSGVPAQAGYTPLIDGTNGGWGIQYTDENYFGAIGDTITVSPTMIVDLRYGVNRVHATAAKPDAGTGFSASTYASWGMPSSVQAYISVPGVAPTIGWTGGDVSFNENWDIWERKNEHQTNHTLAGSVTKLLGKWTLKEGAEYRVFLSNWEDLRSATPEYISGDCNCEAFGGIKGGGTGDDNTAELSGDSTATTLIGAQGWQLQVGTTSTPALAAKYVAFYTQNDWKATPKLTVNLGLRYEVQPGPTERHNQIGSWDLNASNPYSQGGLSAVYGTNNVPGATPYESPITFNPGANLGLFVFAGMPGYSRNLWDTQWNNIAPRIGAAYAIGNASVLRIGYGRVYTPSNTGFNASPPIYGTAGFAGGVNDNPYGTGAGNGLPATTEALGFGDPAGSTGIPALGAVQAPGVYGGTGDPGTFQRNRRNTFMDEWNLSYERRFGGWLASAGYLGSRGTHITWRDEPLNGTQNVPWTVLQGWQSTWMATNGLYDPASLQINNPLPGLCTASITNACTGSGQASGAIGNSTISALNASEAYLAWLGGYQVGDNATSLFHSLQLKAQHSYSSGLSAQFSYMYSRATGITGGQTSSNGNGSTYAQSQVSTGSTPLGGGDYRVNSHNRSLLNYDVPNRFVAVVSYLTPTGKGQRFDPGNPVARAIIGQWNIATVVTLQQGQPWGPNCGSAGGGNAENGRCLYTGQPLKLPHSYEKWNNGSTPVTLPDGRTYTPSSFTKPYWNPDAFTGQIVQWANGTYHQAQYWEGVTPQAMPQLRMPAFQNVNLSVSRKFPITEGMSFEILAEATNAFNHANYEGNAVNNSYGGLITNPAAGSGQLVGQNNSTSGGSMSLSYIDPRQMTLSARFDF